MFILASSVICLFVGYFPVSVYSGFPVLVCFGFRIVLGSVCVDPTRSTGRRDSLLNGRKMWIDFRVLENPSLRRNVFLWSRHLLFVVIL